MNADYTQNFLYSQMGGCKMTENSPALIEIANILEGAEDQNAQRVQEFNSTLFWLMQAETNGMADTVAKFHKEVLENTK